ncbi:hypothetical protein D3C78_1785000 [compost metagenome]
MLAPEQADAAQAAEQHQQAGQARAAVQLSGQSRLDLHGILPANLIRLYHRRIDIGRE